MPEHTLPQQLKRLDRDRLQAYAANLRFFKGHQWTGRPDRRRRRIVLNYARVLIDKVTSYVMGGMNVQIAPLWAAGKVSAAARRRALAAEETLNAVAADNALTRLDYETELDTAVLGDGACKVTWDPELKRVSVTAPDVQGIFAWWDPRDPKVLLRAAQRYLIDPPEAARYGVTTTKPIDAVEDWTAAEVVLWIGDKEVERSPNPPGFVPYVIFPNVPVPKSRWGLSDLDTIRDLAQEVNRAFTQLSRIMEVSGNPITVLEGVDQSTDIAVEPGAIWELPADSKAYLLDLLAKGGVTVQLDFVDRLYRAMHDLAEAPRTAFGDNQRSLSGVALEIELKPLEQKVIRKRLIRSDAYARRAHMILRVLDHYTGSAHADAGTPAVTWGLVAPVDPNADVTRERTRVDSGLSSTRTAMTRLGVDDPQDEWTRWLAERRDIATATPAPSPPPT